MSGSGFDPHLFQRLAAIEPRSFWSRGRNRLIISIVRRHFPGAQSLLEVGCGSGFVLQALRDHFPPLRLVGSELYEEGLEAARKRLSADVELRRLDARALDYEDEFDVVGAFDVIEHIEQDADVLRAMFRAVRDGGGVIILVPQHPWLWSEHDSAASHVRRYTRRELVGKVHAAGFDVVETTSFVTVLLPAMAASRIFERLRRGPYDPLRDLRPGLLNPLFERLLDFERWLIERGISLPFGGSLLVVAKRPARGTSRTSAARHTTHMPV